METLIADNESFITAQQMYLMISEPITQPFALPEGKLLDNITSEDNGDGVLLFPPARGDERARQLWHRRLWNKTMAHYKRRHPSRRDEHLDREKKHSLETLPLQC